MKRQPSRVRRNAVREAAVRWMTSAEIHRAVNNKGHALSIQRVRHYVSVLCAERILRKRCRQLPGVSRPSTSLSHGRHTWIYRDADSI